MKGFITLTPDELAGLVAAVCEYNGLQGTSTLAIYKEGQLVDYDSVVVNYEIAGLAVKTKPDDDQLLDVDRIRSIRGLLYPEVRHEPAPANGSGSSSDSG